MKKLLLAIAFCTTMASCNTTPIIDGEHPFVVRDIIRYDNKLSKYYSYGDAGIYISNLHNYPAIVLPSRLYNIGDTITFKKK
jgi:hypothetical protein